jgi:hypothetical protein
MGYKMPDNNRKKQGGKFQPGQSGNPSGRPAGSKSKVSQLVGDMIAEKAEEITKILIDKALDGDAGCLKLIIERLSPAPKDNNINIELPNITQPGDLTKAIAGIINQVSNGDITPLEGQSLIKMFEGWKAAFSLEEIEQRLCQLEESKWGKI